MFDIILKILRSDARLEDLLVKTQEYADMYLLAKKRHKGCDGLGDMTNLKDEFAGALDKLIKYCIEKKYVADNFSYDVDLMADEIRNLIKK